MRRKPSLYESAREGIRFLGSQIALVTIVLLIIFLVNRGRVSSMSLGIGFVLGTIFVTFSQQRQTLRAREMESAKLPNVIMRPNFNPVVAVVTGDQEKPILNLGSGIVNTGDLSDITGSTLLSQIEGEVTNSIGNLPDSTESSDLDIKELLQELKEAIQSSEDLDDASKADALEQVKTLTEAVQNRNTEERRGAARRALTFLAGTLTLLSPTAKLAELGRVLIPSIKNWFLNQ